MNSLPKAPSGISGIDTEKTGPRNGIRRASVAVPKGTLLTKNADETAVISKELVSTQSALQPTV